MGKGLGSVQSELLSELASHGQSTLETIRWKLWYKERSEPSGVDALIAEPLTPAWNNSVRRAVDGLEKRGAIVVRKRRLRSMEECEKFYGGQSLSALVRHLRNVLLPLLFEWARSKDGPLPRYNAAENEKYAWRNLPDVQRDELRRHWQSAGTALAMQLGKVAEKHRNAIFLLYCKGQSLFETNLVDCRPSFRRLVGDCEAILPADIGRQIARSADLLLTRSQAGFLSLKSLIRVLAEVPRHGACRVAKSTIEFLEKAQPKLLQSLPGYVPREVPKLKGRYAFPRDERGLRATQSETLHRLFDQKVFQKFIFLRPR